MEIRTKKSRFGNIPVQIQKDYDVLPPSSGKEISVVIPVKDNQKGIDQFLKGLLSIGSEAEMPKEIIVIDNNSRIPIEIKLDIGIPVILGFCKEPGPGKARNKGVELASAPWILFTDSDCIPERSFVEGYLLWEEPGVGFAGDVRSLGKDWISKYYEQEMILLPPYDETREHYQPAYLVTANCLILRKAFEAVGGFSDGFPEASGEDIDISIKLRRIGHLRFVQQSVILHDFSDGLIGFCKRFRRYGRGVRILSDLYDLNLTPRRGKVVDSTLGNELLSRLQIITFKKGYYE